MLKPAVMSRTDLRPPRSLQVAIQLAPSLSTECDTNLPPRNTFGCELDHTLRILPACQCSGDAECIIVTDRAQVACEGAETHEVTESENALRLVDGEVRALDQLVAPHGLDKAR